MDHQGWQHRGDHGPPFFLRCKKERANKAKRESVSKQKQLKGCHQEQNVTVLVILKCLKVFLVGQPW